MSCPTEAIVLNPHLSIHRKMLVEHETTISLTYLFKSTASEFGPDIRFGCIYRVNPNCYGGFRRDAVLTNHRDATIEEYEAERKGRRHGPLCTA